MTSLGGWSKSADTNPRKETDRYIFRCDDVSHNTNKSELWAMYYLLEDIGLDFDFWSCVSLISKDNEDGSVYPNPPFKHRDRNFFYESDRLYVPGKLPGITVSHGLLHIDHSQLQFDAQEMSIVTSCNLLGSNIFVPPFNRLDDITDNVCRINNIDLVRYDEGWRCLDREPFDPVHKLWYFHPWRLSYEQFESAINFGVSA